MVCAPLDSEPENLRRPMASLQSQITTDAAARVDEDFADLALQESTGEALSVDALGPEVGARHRLGLATLTHRHSFVLLSLRWYSTDHRADKSVPFRDSSGGA